MLNRLQGVFSSLESHDVHYVVIGGIAAVLYGVPRATLDLDILIEATPENADRLLKALESAGLGTASLTTAKDLLKHEIVVFQDWVRINVRTLTPGLHFDQAWKNRVLMEYQGQTFSVVSSDDLIASKQASARPIDLEDVRLLKLESD